LVARHYGASAEQLSFYRFEGIDNVVRFKNEYRAALDAVELSQAQHDAVIVEAQLAFVKNQDVFGDLDLSSAA